MPNTSVVRSVEFCCSFLFPFSMKLLLQVIYHSDLMKKWKKNKYKNALDKSERAQAPLNTVHGRVNGFPCDEKKNGKTKRKHETNNVWWSLKSVGEANNKKKKIEKEKCLRRRVAMPRCHRMWHREYSVGKLPFEISNSDDLQFTAARFAHRTLRQQDLCLSIKFSTRKTTNMS